TVVGPEGTDQLAAIEFLRFTDAFIGVDDLEEINVNIDNVVYAEGDEGLVEATIVVRLDRALATDLSLDFTTVEDSATAGVDYLVSAGALTIAAGETVGTVTVSVVGDTLPEVDEAFFVDFISGSIPGGRARATVTVLMMMRSASSIWARECSPRRPRRSPSVSSPSSRWTRFTARRSPAGQDQPFGLVATSWVRRW
ncbi:MAG: hypothetical protein HC888_19000, partial [Candidatus Competibacteraceae bacterium]|nr:hypothetical protein [Candidatus Competibacteraceae bacterium]